MDAWPTRPESAIAAFAAVAGKPGSGSPDDHRDTQSGDVRHG